MPTERASLTAILGPTNTGKTHLAVERLCAHSSGMMGFPLRLLAREIYDRLVAIKGEALVALVTGEEKIEPPTARYYCCTVESMPMEREFAFVAVDEAQLGADPERGHIFTDRMLNARGFAETMILGSESLRPVIRALLPDAEIITRPRFSTLSYGGVKKLSRLPKRSAIVACPILMSREKLHDWAMYKVMLPHCRAGLRWCAHGHILPIGAIGWPSRPLLRNARVHGKKNCRMRCTRPCGKDLSTGAQPC